MAEQVLQRLTKVLPRINLIHTPLKMRLRTTMSTAKNMPGIRNVTTCKGVHLFYNRL